MIKKISTLCIVLIAAACSGSTENKTAEEKKDSAAVSDTKNSLDKIKWIEGEWMGMYKGKPFYEIYRLSNDSLLITSYEWDGKDSSNTSVDHLAWKDDAYYLGKEQNYKATVLTDSIIKMIPVKAQNDIVWRKTDRGWDAILAGKKETNVYNMEHFSPFKK